MRIKEYQTRYQTILSMTLTDIERAQMILGLLEDIERSISLSIYNNAMVKEEQEELRTFYRKVLQNFEGIGNEVKKMSIENDNNTLSGFHLKNKKGEPLKVYPKSYNWHIPKVRRQLNIQPGDIVGVGKAKKPFLVTHVFREEFEETGKRYKRVTALYERAPEKE